VDRRLSRVLLGAALLLFVAGLCLRPMAESDLFFRLAAGREILRRHGLPGRNLFSFTYPDYPDPDTSWLFEVGAALVHRLGGFPAIVIAKTAVMLAVFGAAFRLCLARGAGALASVASLAAAAFVARERFVERPHVWSFLGEVAVLAAIDALSVRRGRAAVRAGALFAAAAVLWANLHAGVFVASGLLLLAAVGATIDQSRAGAGESQRGAGARLAVLTGVAVVAALVTPVGPGLFRYLRLHLELPALHAVDEFRAPTWVSDAPLAIYAGVTVAAVAAAAFVKIRRLDFTRVLPVVGLALLTLRSVRFGADLALVSAPLLAITLDELWARFGAGRFPQLSRGPAATVAAVGLLAGFTLVPRLGAAAPAGLGLDTRELPLSAIAFVDDNGLRDRMYNDFEIGSYLIFDPQNGYPRHRVFVDPRLPAYPPEMHRLLGRFDLTRDEWTAAMNRYGVETALLAYAGLNRRVAWWDPEQWALVFREGDARVFVRRLPRYRALIAAREIPATFSFTVEEGTATHLLERRPAASPLADCEWQRRLGDLAFELDGAASARARAAYDRALAGPAGCLAAADEARLGAWLGALALGRGAGEEALSLLDRALAHGDRDVTTLSNRALALEALGRRSQAAAAWTAVAERAAGSPLEARARERLERLRKSE
jgi:tetratricopeptide (TPR) repeat protein